MKGGGQEEEGVKSRREEEENGGEGVAKGQERKGTKRGYLQSPSHMQCRGRGSDTLVPRARTEKKRGKEKGKCGGEMG